MSYSFDTTLNEDFDAAIEKVTEALKQEGFGVLTEIDVSKTLKNKLDVDFPRYRILGACNPHYAYKALQAEQTIGTMLPCNVIVRETESGEIAVSAVDPIASMASIQNPDLEGIATEVQTKLKQVIESL